jgi:polysaccharide biosynthesis/export protein
MIRIYSLLIVFAFILSAHSQDFSKIDASKITPEQMEMYKKYMSSAKISNTQVISNTTEERKTNNDSVLANKLTVSNRIFGSYLFRSQPLTFEPKLNIPTPQNYVLGAYDEILIDISGLHDANYKLKVSTEGTIRIPNVGPVKVAGKSIEEIRKSIKNEISKYYQGVNSGETKVNVSLGNIRSIQVVVAGEAVRPGTYTLPSLATAFNALYACGGPNEIGSYRSVKVIRSGKIVSKLDVYGFLIDGIAVNDIPLKDNDLIRIEPYKLRISVDGEIKRSGIFELQAGESLKKAINFAGGFSDKAEKGLIRVFKSSKDGKTVIDISESEFDRFIPTSGDSIVITSVLEKIAGYTVSIAGAVRKTGKFALSENSTLKDLLITAEGFTEMAFNDSVEIIRAVKNLNALTNSNRKSIVFKLKIPKDINQIGADSNFKLQNGDQVVVRTIPGFEDIRLVRIEGEVTLPGNYNITNKSERISDLLGRVGGLTPYAYSAGVVLIRTQSKDQTEEKINSLISSNLLNSFEKKQNNSIDMNLLKSAGVNPVGDLSKVDSLQNKLSGNLELDKIFNSEEIVGLDIEQILNNRGGKSDLILEQGDVIFVPRKQQTVRVVGKVLFPTMVSYDEKYKVNDYIYSSGGFAENANKNNIFVLYANGSVRGTKKFLFFKSYPVILPGSRIIVSEKPMKLINKMSVGETIGVFSSTASMAVLIYSVLKK